MRGREMLDTIEHLNPAYIEAAAEKPKAKKAGWRKWGAMPVPGNRRNCCTPNRAVPGTAGHDNRPCGIRLLP